VIYSNRLERDDERKTGKPSPPAWGHAFPHPALMPGLHGLFSPLALRRFCSSSANCHESGKEPASEVPSRSRQSRSGNDDDGGGSADWHRPPQRLRFHRARPGRVTLLADSRKGVVRRNRDRSASPFRSASCGHACIASLCNHWQRPHSACGRNRADACCRENVSVRDQISNIRRNLGRSLEFVRMVSIHFYAFGLRHWCPR
jgi:hypothetical protein